MNKEMRKQIYRVKTFKQFVNEQFNKTMIKTDDLSRLSFLNNISNSLLLSKEDDNTFELDKQSTQKLKELQKNNVEYFLISFKNKCQYIKYAVDYFKSIGIDVSNLSPKLYILLRDDVSMGKTTDAKKVSESSANTHQFISFNIKGGMKSDYSLKGDEQKCAWLIHEIGHELFNRGLSGKFTDEINKLFSEFLKSNQEFQSVANKFNKKPFEKNGILYYEYPDSIGDKEERVACYHQYSYLISKGRTYEQVLPFLKDSYYSLWDDYRAIYFKMWFDFLKSFNTKL
jgi:hypothetical protein